MSATSVGEVVVYRASRIVTMEPANPAAEAIAVRDGRILAVGSVDEMSIWGDFTFDDTFADHVLYPGFVEAHSHHLEGGIWAFEYVGFFDRQGPDGVVRQGLKSIDALITRLRELEGAMSDPDEQLIVWGFDPIYLDGERMVGRHLDAVSETRPICLFHASGHLATVNTALMEFEGFADGIDMEGVPCDSDGRPIGELQEPAAMTLALTAMRRIGTALNEPEAIERLGLMARRAGCTTVTELGGANLSIEQLRSTWRDAVMKDTYPTRVVMFHNASHGNYETADDFAAAVVAIADESTERIRFGSVKIVLDGSIQGFTARLNWPGYVGGHENGIWLYTPEAFRDVLLACHRVGVLVHVHCNGDEAVDLFIEVMAEAERVHPQLDHRYTVQHCQLTTPSQYRQMAALGLNANIFSNHIFYWGDQHHDLTVGPERAKRMNACATAKREGVRFSIHSDASITPLGHLHTMWCAVNRLTATGRVLGPEERIDVDAALRAVTIDAAHQLRMDHEIGSLHAGKFADMVALEADPRDVDPIHIKDIGVVGTVVGGVVHLNH